MKACIIKSEKKAPWLRKVKHIEEIVSTVKVMGKALIEYVGSLVPRTIAVYSVNWDHGQHLMMAGKPFSWSLLPCVLF